MAFGATMIWAVQTTGSDARGGGFATVTTNMATDLAATSATGTSPVVTSASYTFIARDVGHWLYIAAGTNWTAGWYLIASVTGGAATLTAGIGTAVLIGGLSTNTVAGCATTASPTGGTWSVDYSQTNAAGVSFTDLVINGAVNTSFTSAANPLGKNFVGNVINVTSGTGFTVQRVQITNVTGTTGTADKSMGTLSSTGGNGALGGALASPGMAQGLMVASNKGFLKSGTYTLTSSNNVSGGRVTMSVATVWWAGFQNIRGDGGTKPVVRPSANGVTLFTLTSANPRLTDIEFQANGMTTCVAIDVQNSRMNIFNCKFNGIHNGITAIFANDSEVRNCLFTGLTGQYCILSSTGSTSFQVRNCVAVDCTCTTGAFAGCMQATRCYADTITSGAGFGTTTAGKSCFIECVAYECTGIGFSLVGNSSAETCVAYGCGGVGFGGSAATIGDNYIRNCAGGDNTGGNYVAADFYAGNVENFIPLSSNPFTDAPNGDFSFNDASGGGNDCKSIPVSLPGLTTTIYNDAGLQHDVGGGGGTVLLNTGLTGGLI